MSYNVDYKLVRNSSVGPELYEDEAISLPAKPGVLKYGELLVSERGVTDPVHPSLR